MSLFSWFLAIAMTLMTWRLVRRMFLLPPAETELDTTLYLDPGDAEPLPEDYVQPLGDACVDITRASLDALGELDAAQKSLAAGDGHGQHEAPIRLERAFVSVREAAEHAADLSGSWTAPPEEVGWWLGHVLEQCEAICSLQDTAAALVDTPANAVHRAAVAQGIEAAENLLLGAHDFSVRLLDFDLNAWIREEIGQDSARRFERAIADAARRSP